MKRSTRLLITAAAIAGLYTGSMASRAFAADQAGSADKAKADTSKHDCKGKNGCKGQGWNEMSDKDCKSKNGTVVSEAAPTK